MANYLYNGMELPALPKTTYPIAVMDTALYGMLKNAILYLFSELEYTTIESNGDRGLLLTESNHVRFSATATDTEWTAESGTAGALNINNIGWANTDILNADGTLYLAASEPIPVNPAPTLDPTALLMGWQVGNRIRQRGGA